MKHVITATRMPVKSGAQSTPDGAITGNGDLAVILGSFSGGLRLHLSKTDLIYAAENHDAGGVRPLGSIDVPVPPDARRRFTCETDMDEAVIRCRFDGEDGCMTLEITAAKTENAVLLRFGGEIAGNPVLRLPRDAADGVSGIFAKDGVRGIFRSFHSADCSYETHAFAAIKKVADGLFCLRTETNHGCADPETAVTSALNGTTEESVGRLYAAHREKWAEFWEKSSFSCSDPVLENGWYASQYFLAVSAGNAAFPPGLYANFITVERPGWKSDLHLNYNYQAPFYAACSSNHPELTDCYLTPLEQFAEKGRGFAKRFGCRGLLYPVGILPGGLCSEKTEGKYGFLRLFLGQKSNALHAADIAVFRWNATRDLAYARDHAYPYIKDCLAFFEDYAVYENGRYDIPDDAAHEVPIYRDDFRPSKFPFLHDKNNCLTLGLLKMTLSAAIDMAAALDTDADKRALWADMLGHLAPFPVTVRHGQRVFRYTQKGQRWNDDNDVGQQHLYPCDALRFFGKRENRIAMNTFRQKSACFEDENAAASYYPMAARMKIGTDELYGRLKDLFAKRGLDNGLFDFAGGCLENCSVFASTLNESVMQSFRGGKIELFPCLPGKTDIAFRDLLADGAVLVSSSVTGGMIGKTTLKCLVDRDTLELTLPAANKKDVRVTGAAVRQKTEKDGVIALSFGRLTAGSVITIE